MSSRMMRPPSKCRSTARTVSDNAPKRVPVDFRYDAVNPHFLKALAKIGAYAAEKYGSWEQYKNARLKGEKSPINHVYEHIRQYVCGEAYDHFDGDPRWHLAAAAYNLMMEFHYHYAFGHDLHPLAEDVPSPDKIDG